MSNKKLSCYATPFGNMVHYSDDRCIGLSLREYGEWAPGETSLLKNFILPGHVVFDVGANIGFHTRFFSGCVGDTGNVFSFEPQESIYKLLTLNNLLGQADNVEAMHCLVGDETKVVHSASMRIKPGNYGAASYDLSRSQNASATPIMQIQLDDIPVEACHLIKIDVEGMELSVLGGARKTIETHRPVLFFEQNSEKNYFEIIHLLNQFGYAFYWSVSPAFPRFNMYGKCNDLFRGAHETNILAVPTEKTDGFPFLSHLMTVDQKSYRPPKLSVLPEAYGLIHQSVSDEVITEAKNLSTVFNMGGLLSQ